MMDIRRYFPMPNSRVFPSPSPSPREGNIFCEGAFTFANATANTPSRSGWFSPMWCPFAKTRGNTPSRSGEFSPKGRPFAKARVNVSLRSGGFCSMALAFAMARVSSSFRSGWVFLGSLRAAPAVALAKVGAALRNRFPLPGEGLGVGLLPGGLRHV